MSRKKQGGVVLLLAVIGIIWASLTYPWFGGLLIELTPLITGVQLPEAATYLPDFATLRTHSGLEGKLGTYGFIMLASGAFGEALRRIVAE